MYGAIIGDIAGSIYEYEGFTCKDPTRITFFKGHEGYTDDTVLTVAITEAILNKGEYKDYLLA
ncbi:hypothetical protein FACS1894166_02770 [Bacilli bacterium]|nr:hypothetical protein FACS1894166_02770 [Bacilli bacterium]